MLFGSSPKPVLAVEWWYREDEDYIIGLTNGYAYRGECTNWDDYDTAEHVSAYADVHGELMRFEKLIEWGRLNDKEGKPGQ